MSAAGVSVGAATGGRRIGGGLGGGGAGNGGGSAAGASCAAMTGSRRRMGGGAVAGGSPAGSVIVGGTRPGPMPVTGSALIPRVACARILSSQVAHNAVSSCSLACGSGKPHSIAPGLAFCPSAKSLCARTLLSMRANNLTVALACRLLAQHLLGQLPHRYRRLLAERGQDAPLQRAQLGRGYSGCSV